MTRQTTRDGREGTLFAALLSLVVVLVPSNGRAEEIETVCEDPRVRIQGRPNVRWIRGIQNACERLQTMRDADATASVRLVPAGVDLIVEVVLTDGRSTLRRVSAPPALPETLEALLAVPPVVGLAAPTVPTSTENTETFVGDFNRHDDSTQNRPTRADAPTLGVELGGAVGARIAGDAYVSFAPGMFAQIRVGDWLFGMNARWDVFQEKATVDVARFEMETFAAGIAVARRFNLQIANIDLGLSPKLLAETQSFQPVTGPERADTQTDVRLDAFARVAFGHAPVRAYVEGDAELSPARIRRNVRLDASLPSLPAWSAGLSVGVVWGEL